MNLPNRVPVFANPHEGSSIWRLSSAFQTASVRFVFIITPSVSANPSPSIETFLKRFLDFELLRTPARLIPRPTEPLRRRPPQLCHSRFPAAPPSGWQNCPKLWTPSSQAIPPAQFVPQPGDSTESSCSPHPQ